MNVANLKIEIETPETPTIKVSPSPYKVNINKNGVKYFYTSDNQHLIYSTDTTTYYLLNRKESKLAYRSKDDFARIDKKIDEITPDDVMQHLSTIQFRRNLITEEDEAQTKLHYNKLKKNTYLSVKEETIKEEETKMKALTEAVIIDGIKYGSVAEASRKLHHSGRTIRKMAGLPARELPSDKIKYDRPKTSSKSKTENDNKDIIQVENTSNLTSNTASIKNSDTILIEKKIAELKADILTLEKALFIINGKGCNERLKPHNLN